MSRQSNDSRKGEAKTMNCLASQTKTVSDLVGKWSRKGPSALRCALLLECTAVGKRGKRIRDGKY